MRFRSSNRSASLPKSMSAMIDVVFLLLIFFMLTLQIAAPEGVHAVEMPAEGTTPPVINTPDIRVRLIADDAGRLAELRLGNRHLGSGDEAIDRLGKEIHALSFEARGIVNEGIPIIIEADADLDFGFSLRAMGVCQKHRGPDGQVEKLVTRVQMVAP